MEHGFQLAVARSQNTGLLTNSLNRFSWWLIVWTVYIELNISLLILSMEMFVYTCWKIGKQSWKPEKLCGLHKYICGAFFSGSASLSSKALKRRIFRRINGNPSLDSLKFGCCNIRKIKMLFSIFANKLRRSVVAAGEKQATADYRISKRYKQHLLLLYYCHNNKNICCRFTTTCSWYFFSVTVSFY